MTVTVTAQLESYAVNLNQGLLSSPSQVMFQPFGSHALMLEFLYYRTFKRFRALSSVWEKQLGQTKANRAV